MIGDTGQLVKVAGSNCGVYGGIILKSKHPRVNTPETRLRFEGVQSKEEKRRGGEWQ